MKTIRFDYLIIGNGRLASHFKKYFDLSGITYQTWWRDAPFTLPLLLRSTKKVLLLISDDAIENFLLDHRAKDNQPIWIHCSGSIDTPLAENVHPLMTFGDQLYSLATYQKIPFITTNGRPCFQELFPDLINPNSSIPSQKRLLYHAWASMAGNFSSLLWSTYFERLEEEFGFDRHLATPYLDQIFANIKSSTNPITGPLSRGDTQTITRHLQSLEHDDFKTVYSAFVEAFHDNQSSEVHQ